MKIEYGLKASAELGALPKDIQSRIIRKMRFYAEQTDPLMFAKRLRRNDLFRFRAGDYRIIFKVEDQIIYIITVKRRDRAYKDLDLD